MVGRIERGDVMRTEFMNIGGKDYWVLEIEALAGGATHTIILLKEYPYC